MNFFSRSVSTPNVGALTNSNADHQEVGQLSGNSSRLKDDDSVRILSFINPESGQQDSSKTEWEHCRDPIESLERFVRSIRDQTILTDSINYETMLMAAEVKKILERLVEIDPAGFQSHEMQTRILKAIKGVLNSKCAMRFLLVDDTVFDQPSFDKWMDVFLSIVENSGIHQMDMFSHGFRDKTASRWWESKETCLAILLQILTIDEQQVNIKSCHKKKLIELCAKYTKIIGYQPTKLIVTTEAMSLCLKCLIEICVKPLALRDRIEILRKILLPMKRLQVKLSTDWKFEWASQAKYPLGDANNWFYMRRYSIHKLVNLVMPIADELLLSICSDTSILKKVTLFVEQIFDLDQQGQTLESRAAALRILGKLECKVSTNARPDYRALVIEKFAIPMLKITNPSVLKYTACLVISQDPYPGLFLGGSVASRWKNCIKLLIKLAHNDSEVYIRIQAMIALAHLSPTGGLGGVCSEYSTKQMVKWQTENSIYVNNILNSLIKWPIDGDLMANQDSKVASGSKSINLMSNYLHLNKKTQAIINLSSLYRKQSINVLVQNLESLSEFLMIALRHQEHRKVPSDPQLPCQLIDFLNRIVEDAIKVMNMLQISAMEHVILNCVKSALDYRGEITMQLRPKALELLRTLTCKLVTRTTFKFLEIFEKLLHQYESYQQTPSSYVNIPSHTNLNRDIYIGYIAPILYNLITLEPKLLVAVPEHLRRILKMNIDIMISCESNEDRAYAAKLVEIALIENMDTLTGRKNNFDSQVIEAACLLLLENDYQRIIEATVNHNTNRLDSVDQLEIIRSRSDLDFCSQLTNLICMAFGFDLHKTLDTFVKIEMNRKMAKNSLLDYLIKCILDYDATSRQHQQHKDCFHTKHGTRIMIRALCSLIRMPNNLRPRCLIDRYDELLPRIIGHFEFLHRCYEDNLGIVGFTMRFKYPESTYLNWESQIDSSFLLNSKLERNSKGFKDEIRIIKNSLTEIRRTDPAWVDRLLSSLTRSQATLLEDLYSYIKENNGSIDTKPTGLFRRIHGSFRLKGRKDISLRSRKKSI